MDYTKLLLATLGGTVVMFFSGWLIWGIGLLGLHQGATNTFEGLTNEMPNMGLMVAAMVPSALLFALVFHKWASIKTFMTGAKAGAVIATLMGLGHDLMWMASSNLYEGWTVLLSNIAGNLVWGALAGGVIGWILGRGE